jgi:hypothetical protein
VNIRRRDPNARLVFQLAGIYKKTKKMKNLLLLGDLDQKIIRALEDGADYQPDWRHLQVQQYLKDIYHEHAEPLRRTRLNQILKEEFDPFVRHLVSFSCGRPGGNEEAIEYAVKCWRDNFKTLSASRIKAMVLANGTPERIAHEIGTTEDKIDTFEKLYFDVRRYLKHRGWLASICFPAVKPDAAIAVESRWFAVAFRRGWPGVEEVVLGHVDKGCERTLQHAASVLLGRVDDYCWGLEVSGTAPSESDVRALLALARIGSVGLPVLWDEQQPSRIDPAFKELARLSAGGRERVFFAVTEVLRGTAAKALTLESEGSKIEPSKA